MHTAGLEVAAPAFVSFSKFGDVREGGERVGDDRGLFRQK